MGSKVLTSIPSVAPGVDLICAGHPADPGKLPPGVVTVPCHRCGRPVALYRTPDPTSHEPATDFVGPAPDAVRGAVLAQEDSTQAAPEAGREQEEEGQAPRDVRLTQEDSTPAVNADDDDPDRTPLPVHTADDLDDAERTPAAPRRTVTREASTTGPMETCEMPAVNISSEDLAELSAIRRERSGSGRRLAPPVPVEDHDILGTPEPSDEPTVRQATPPPSPRRTASR